MSTSQTPQPSAINRQGAVRDDADRGVTPDDPTLLFRSESEMSAAERSRLIPPPIAPRRLVLPIEVTARHSAAEADVLAAKLNELRALATQLTPEHHRIETASHEADDRVKTIVDRLAALTAVAEDMSRKSTETLRRLEQLSPATTAPPPVGRSWSVVGVIGVAALVGLMVTRPGEDAAQAGSHPEVVQATIPSNVQAPILSDVDSTMASDIALPETISIVVVPTAGGAKTPTARPAVKAPPQTVKAPPQTVKAPPQNVQVRAPGFIGTLAIQSSPAGAAVFVDRERVGATPIELPRLRAGSRLVWIEHEGYQRWTASVLVPAERRTQVSAQLVPASDR